MPAIEVICLLGKVHALDPAVDVDVSEAAPNSSKWIFDVSQDARLVQRFELQLLDNQGRVRESAWFSPTLTPICALAAGARLRVPEPDAPTIALECDPVDGVVEYRVTIDAVHSSTR